MAGSGPHPDRQGWRFNPLSLLSVACAFVIWFVVSNYIVVDSLSLPSPQVLLATFIDLIRDGYGQRTLLEHILTSMGRALAGFSLAVICSSVIGLVAGYSSAARAIIMPFIDFLRPIPALALVPLFVFFFGIGDLSKIGLIFIGAFIYMTLQTSEGVRSIPQEFAVAEDRRVGTDENTRYPDFLARRLHLLDPGRRMTVSNAGIAGAMLADRPDTANIEGAMQRFGRDVLGTEGVRGLVVLLGTNDLGQSAVSTRSFTSQLCAVVQRARRQGIHVVLGTIPPGGSATYDDPRRGPINEWIRRSVDARIADGVADFDAVLRVSETDSRIRTPFLAYGDEYGVHPNSDGYEAMAAAVPLAVLNEDEAPFEVTCS